MGMHGRTTMGVAAARIAAVALVAGGVIAAAQQQQPQSPPAVPASQQPSEIRTTITSGGAGAAPRFAVPDFVALSKDRESVEAARLMGQVLFDDLNFEREFALIPRDVYSTVRAASSLQDVPFDAWRELNADGVIAGIVQKTDTGLRVEVRLYNVRTRESAFGQEYTAPIATARRIAHTIADQIHEQQRNLRGVARTRLAFHSDRDGERIGGAENRGVREIYISDYDGENQRRVTTQRSLNNYASWSPDGRSISYTSYRRGPPQIFISHIYEGTLQELTKNSGNNYLPAWSPDGTRLVFASTMEGSGNTDIYIVNRDGSNLRRLTNHPAADTTPTWSPTGTQIAFTSDRTGQPQIYIMGVDGLGQQRLTVSESYADRATWSPAPYNEIAFASRTGPGTDIKIMELSSRKVMQLTFGEGSNESPSFAPNGRHLAFSSTRAGKSQIFTMTRDGRGLRQVTRTGNNYAPNWSR
jgi:TolB protein